MSEAAARTNEGKVPSGELENNGGVGQLGGIGLRADDGKVSQCCIYFLKTHDNTEASSSEDGELTPGFVSENDGAENYKEAELESLEDCLPLTAQRIRDAQNKRAPR